MLDEKDIKSLGEMAEIMELGSSDIVWGKEEIQTLRKLLNEVKQIKGAGDELPKEEEHYDRDGGFLDGLKTGRNQIIQEVTPIHTKKCMEIEELKKKLKVEKDIMDGQTPRLPYNPTQKEMIQLAIDTIRGHRNTPYILVYDKEKKTIIAISIHDRIKKLQQQLKEVEQSKLTKEEFRSILSEFPPSIAKDSGRPEWTQGEIDKVWDFITKKSKYILTQDFETKKIARLKKEWDKACILMGEKSTECHKLKKKLENITVKKVYAKVFDIVNDAEHLRGEERLERIRKGSIAMVKELK